MKENGGSSCKAGVENAASAGQGWSLLVLIRPPPVILQS